MQSQVVGAGEAALAVGALERLDARVLAEVSRQLIRPGELPRAAFPHALVGLLSCVCPAMSLEVGALGVHLVAASEIAAVNPPFLQRVGRVDRERMLGTRVDDHRGVITLAVDVWNAHDRG